MRLGLDLGRVNQGALNHGFVVLRYPGYAGAAPIAGIALVLDVDLLRLFGQPAAIHETRVDPTDPTDHQHHLENLVLGHAADPIAPSEAT